MKMYILIRESIPLGNAMVAVAHASLACYLRFAEHPDVTEWLSGRFYKVVCQVSDKEFERARAMEDHVVITESALDGAEVAMALRPRAEWPKAMRFLKLYR